MESARQRMVPELADEAEGPTGSWCSVNTAKVAARSSTRSRSVIRSGSFAGTPQRHLTSTTHGRTGCEMAEVLLFHHAQGQTSGFHAFADELRKAGHTVHTPDLYDGRTFDTLDEGVAYAGKIGFGEIVERGVRAADELPTMRIYAGFSLGVLPAQKLAQTRPGARGALLFHACVPTSEFGDSWPADVPVRVHGMEADRIFVDEGDLDAARALVESAKHAELFLYPGDQHLFADASLPSYDADAAALLNQRVLDFLATR
jgi:dienelactone hydrolase